MPNRRREATHPTIHELLLRVLPFQSPGTGLTEILPVMAAYKERTVSSALREMIAEGYVASTRVPGRKLYRRTIENPETL